MSARHAAWRLFQALQCDDADRAAAHVAHAAMKALMLTPVAIRETALAEVGLSVEFVADWVSWHLAEINSHLISDDSDIPIQE